jgi:hypothetical protein
MNENIRCGMQKKPELIRSEAVTGSPVGFQVQLMIFDIKLVLAPGAVYFLIQHRRFGGFHVGNDKTDIFAVLGKFQLSQLSGGGVSMNLPDNKKNGTA